MASNRCEYRVARHDGKVRAGNSVQRMERESTSGEWKRSGIEKATADVKLLLAEVCPETPTLNKKKEMQRGLGTSLKKVQFTSKPQDKERGHSNKIYQKGRGIRNIPANNR